MNTRRLALFTFLFVLAAPASFPMHLDAQGTGAPAAQPAFEVASVKRNNSGTNFRQILGAPGGRFTATNIPVRMLIRTAYQLQDFQIVGGPSWTATDGFDINAKGDVDTSTPTTPGQPGPMALMMRALLADRFRLKVHNETRELPIYAIVVARSDGKLGPALHASTAECAGRGGSGGPGGQSSPAPSPNQPPACGIRIAPGQISGRANPLAQLATVLSPIVQRVVLDRTGLTGSFDFDLTYTPEQMPAAQGPPPPGAPPIPPIDPNGPSVYTAVQEQLGLKLDSQKGPVNVIVIDSVEPPTDD